MELIKNCDINKLREWSGNPRKHDEDVDMLVVSIRAHGFKDPIEVDKNFVILAGHGRREAALKMGLTEVPVLKHDVDKLVQAYVLANNKTAERSEWDYPKLKEVMHEIDTGEFALEVTGFDLGEIEDIMTYGVEPEEDEKADSVPEAPKEAVSKLGEMYQLGEHRLICGDCTDVSVVEKLMRGEKADMVFTDPPYGMKKEKEGVLNDNPNLKDLLDFNMKWIPVSFGCLKENGSWYCWGIDEPLMDIYTHIIKPYIAEQKATFRNLITWDKGHGQGQMAESFRMYPIADEKCLFVMCGVQGFNNNAERAYFDNTHENQNNVWHFARHEKTGAEGGHATPKPIPLCERGVVSSCPKDGVTLDFFLGSGSTLIACEKTKRKCYGVELEPKYCDVIRKRWAEYVHGEGVDWQKLTPRAVQ